MPRLVVNEPRQQGYTTGSPRIRSVAARDASPPGWMTRASRLHPEGLLNTPINVKPKRVVLTPNRQAALILAYKQLPRDRAARSAQLKELCAEYGVSTRLPARLCRKVNGTKKLPTRKGKGGRKLRITPAVAEELKSVLKEHAYELNYRQIEELTGIPTATVWRFVKSTPGWRQSSKSTRPLLSDEQKAKRLEWARKHKKNPWTAHVDIDEKWFYTYSHSGKQILPPGVQKPKKRLKSKRFIGKIMCLTAIARPDEKLKNRGQRRGFDGKVGCWRITENMVYKRRTVYHGTTYEKGDERRVDTAMDSEKFAQMLIDDVFPAVRQKFHGVSVVRVQFDNAGGHGMASLMNRIKTELPSTGPRVPRIEIVSQAAQAPDTNANNLGFYRSIDSRLPKVRNFDLDEFEKQILAAFKDYPSKTLNDLFDMKQRVCQCIIDAKGDNDFPLPHRKG